MTKEFIQKFAALITGAFSLLAALAWNDAVRSFINTYISKGEDVISSFIYAFIVTIIAVTASYYISKFASEIIKREERLAKKVEKLQEELKENKQGGKNEKK
jgi:uncharacterized membrane protein (DUF106 family)